MRAQFTAWIQQLFIRLRRTFTALLGRFSGSRKPKRRSRVVVPEPLPLERFFSLNQQVFAELLTFLDFAEGFTLGLVEINFPPDGVTLVEVLQQRCSEMQFVVIDVSEQPELRFLRDEIAAQLAQAEREPEKELVLVVRGLARAIGTDLKGDGPPVLQDLNFVRDAYKLYVPYPLLLVLPDYAITRLIKFAPDFWAWHSGVFTFKTPETTRKAAHSQALETYQHPVCPTIPEPMERIELLERLLMDYRPSHGATPTRANLNTCSSILYELGVAHRSHRNFAKAENYLQDALALAKQKQDISLQIKVHIELGNTYRDERKYDRATIEFESALNLAENIQSQHQEAASLFYLGYLHLDQRQFTQATDRYQQCLAIEQKINDRYNQARTYHQLGRVAEKLREYEQARSYFQQTLDIEIEFNDRYSQASTYHHLGTVAQELKEYEQARLHFQQALDIEIEFSDRYSQAKTYCCLGSVFRRLKEYEKAKIYYQKSMDRYLEFNDIYALENFVIPNFARLYKITQDDDILSIVAAGLGQTVEAVQERFEQIWGDDGE